MSLKSVARPFTRSQRPSRRRLAVMSVVCATIVASASGVAAAVLSSSQVDGSPLQLSPATGTSGSLGNDPTSIVDAIKARVPNVVSLDLGDDPITSASGTSTFEALVAHAKIAESAPAGAGVAQAMWAGNLIGGALKTAFSQAGLTSPESVDVTLIRPDGSTDHIGGGIGNVVPNQLFDAVTPTVQSRVEQNAALQGLTDVRFSSFRVLSDVIRIQAETSEPPTAAVTAFTRSGGLDGLLGVSANDFESVYFELDDHAGNPLLITAANPRAGAGVFWADPSTGADGDLLKFPTQK